MKLKKGDPVVVLQGKDKGKEGTIMRVFPKQGKVIVEGVNMVKKHQRPTRATMQGGIIDKDMPLDVSKVAYLHKGRATRIGYRIEPDGKKVRIARTTGDVIE
jgi:large subunit ribosomal protein L24